MRPPRFSLLLIPALLAPLGLGQGASLPGASVTLPGLGGPAVVPLAAPDAAAGPSAAAPQDAAEQRRFLAARKLLDEEKPEEAAVKALEGLAFAPFATEGYELMLEVARLRADGEDEIRWAKWLYWAHAYSGREDEAKEMAELLEELHPDWDLDEPVIRDWADATLKAARDAAKDKRYRLAGHLFGKVLDLRQNDAKLITEYERLLKRAGEQVSGGAFVADSVRRRSARWILRQNEKHSEWEDAFERKTQHFLVKTTISYELFETVCVVMEDMFDFYQEVYNYKKKSPRMKLSLHKTRADFDRYNHEELGSSLPLNVGGWFFPRELLVSAYVDNVLANEKTEEELMNTLFHECSHYFMHLLTEKAGNPPGWLNEGTASFFEGCELKADGTIVKNKPAASRVREWEYTESRSPLTLKQLVSYHQPGSYGGEYYAYGWSLVYFLLNYEENDPRITGAKAEPGPDGEPVLPVGPLAYREAYLDYLKSYTKRQKKGGENSYERCVRIFVDEIGDPEVPDWEAFEARWRKFTQAIVRESKAGPELADTLQARCRGYLAAEDYERALIAAEQADDKRGDDPATFRLLAAALEGGGKKADALFWMLRSWEQSLGVDDEEGMASAEAWMLERGARDLVEGYCQPTRDALASINEVIDQVADDDYPYLGQMFAAHFIQAAGVRPKALEKRVGELRRESGLDLRLWQRAFPENGVAAWKGRINQEKDSSVLIYTPENRSNTTLRVGERNLRHLAPPFDIRGTIQIDGRERAQIRLGVQQNGLPRKTVEIENGAELSLYDVYRSFKEGESASTVFARVKQQSIASAQFFHFLVEVDARGGGSVTVGEEAQATFPEDWTAEEMSGGVAIGVGQDTAALFRDLVIRPREAFWPVAPREESGD